MSIERRSQLLLCIILFLIAVTIVAVGLASRSSGVRVTDSAPRDGAENVPITTPIRLRFSQPMDRDSVEGRFHIEPEIQGSFVWKGNDALFAPLSALSPTTSYSVTLNAGSVSERGQDVQQDFKWRFHTRSPQLLYLARPDSDASLRQIFAADELGSPSRQLTNTPWGVWDYAVHPQGEAITYSGLREDGGTDLWRMNRDGSDPELLLACPEFACLNPVWSPDGRQVAHERRDIWAEAPNLDPKAGSLWLFDVEEGDTKPLFDYDVAAHSAAWALDGNRIAYVSPLLPGIEVYHLETEELQQFGNQWGATPEWSPDGTRLVLPELVMIGEEFVVRLVIIDLEDDHAIDISGDDDLVKDDSPAWSPGGGWIAHGHKFLDDERWTPGRQIWLTRPDGSESYPLLAEPMADLFGATWRPDGAALAYLLLDMSEGPQPVPDVSIWAFDLVTRKSTLVADQGVLPRWLP